MAAILSRSQCVNGWLLGNKCEANLEFIWKVFRDFETFSKVISRWRHEMQTFSALLPLCVVNSSVTGEFPAQMAVTRSVVFFDLRLTKRLSKQSRRRWFETPSRSLWRDCNGILEHLIKIISRWACYADTARLLNTWTHRDYRTRGHTSLTVMLIQWVNVHVLIHQRSRTWSFNPPGVEGEILRETNVNTIPRVYYMWKQGSFQTNDLNKTNQNSKKKIIHRNKERKITPVFFVFFFNYFVFHLYTFCAPTETHHTAAGAPVSISEKTSFRKIS